MDDRSGIMLVATGERYQLEAAQCAQSFRNQMPSIPICLFTRGVVPNANPFDQILQLPDGIDSFSDKILAMQAWPFERILFVDTDTYCIEPVADLFSMLDRWDLAAAHAPVRQFQHDPPDVPAYFPECNTGVIAIRRNEKTTAFVDNWLVLHAANCARIGPRAADQPSFRQALWESDLRLLTLTPEYNLRTCMHYFIGGNASVKIVHDRGRGRQRLLELIKKQPVNKFPRVR
ncbi:hypothetical protein CA51_41900 [Rosistilla oblonga]|uniref:hypothetical protein n=1 Tax=Rosistilla oblonga TaxID=2527990 RepID=UPI00118C15B4|nr:hypothetical protein [Rosistilla oblonga]QDV14293.1 hypothetical protein CA51_41900 [Rosistilla oblonga]